MSYRQNNLKRSANQKRLGRSIEEIIVEKNLQSSESFVNGHDPNSWPDPKKALSLSQLQSQSKILSSSLTSSLNIPTSTGLRLAKSVTFSPANMPIPYNYPSNTSLIDYRDEILASMKDYWKSLEARVQVWNIS